MRRIIALSACLLLLAATLPVSVHAETIGLDSAKTYRIINGGATVKRGPLVIDGQTVYGEASGTTNWQVTSAGAGTFAALLGKALTAYVSTETALVLSADEAGKVILHTPGSTAAVYLPATVGAAGTVYYYLLLADQSATVSKPGGTIITNGNLTAASAAFSTSSHKIGGMLMIISNGTDWCVVNVSDCTMTVGT